MSDNPKVERFQQTPEAFRRQIKDFCHQRWDWLFDEPGKRPKGGDLDKTIPKFIKQITPALRQRLRKVLGSQVARGILVFVVVSSFGVLLKRAPKSSPEQLNPGPERPKSILEILFDDLESISLGSAGIIFLLETSNRRKKDHYEAWRVINSAMGNTGSGGRIKALQDLANDQVDLKGVAVQDAYLSGIKLNHASLEGANMSNTKLIEARLNRADLRHADMQGANLDKADLTEADLKWVDLRAAYLRGTVLKNADLKVSNLQGAWLTGADLRNADLNEALLQNAYLTASIMQGANLRNADLQGASAFRAKLQGADLTQANLQNATLEEAELKNATLREAKLQNVNLIGAKLQGADLTQANLQGAKLQGANLQGANLKSADLTGANLQGADLQGAKLLDANLCEASYLTHSQIMKAKLCLTRLPDDIRALVNICKDCQELIAIDIGSTN